MKTTHSRTATVRWRRDTKRLYRQFRSYRTVCNALVIPESLAPSVRRAIRGEVLRYDTLKQLGALPATRNGHTPSPAALYLRALKAARRWLRAAVKHAGDDKARRESARMIGAQIEALIENVEVMR